LNEKFSSPDRPSALASSNADEVYETKYTGILTKPHKFDELASTYVSPKPDRGRDSYYNRQPFDTADKKDDDAYRLRVDLREARDELAREKSINDNTQFKASTETRTLHDSLRELERSLEQEKERNSELQAEIETLKDSYEQRIVDTKNEKFNEKDLKIQELNRQIKSINLKHKDYLDEISYDYETQINKLKEEHENTIRELNHELERKNQEINRITREKTDLSSNFTKKTNSLQDVAKSNQDAATKLQQTIGVKNDEIEKLNRKLNENKREFSIIKSESELHEQEKTRIAFENDKLRAHVNKLEKIVYGKSVSPAKTKQQYA